MNFLPSHFSQFAERKGPVSDLSVLLPTNYARSCFSTLVWLGLVALVPLALRTDRAIAQAAPTTAFPSGIQGVDAATVLIVNPTAGDDATADGSDRAPFKTITQALNQAQPNTVIQLMPGTYSAETGESFPLQLKPGTIIQGNASNRGADVVIRGSGFFLSPTSARQNVTILGANQARLIGVTVTNPHAQGYGLWVESTSPVVTDNTFTANGHDGVSVTGNGAPLIRNNFFYQNNANGITIYGTSRPELRENIFEQTGFAININQNAIPLIIGNRITQNKDGVVVQAKAKPILRNNSIEGNERDGLVAIAQSYPDLGTNAEPGGNFIRNNGQFDVNAKGTNQRILAFGNELAKTVGMVDTSGSDPAITPVAGNLDAVQPSPAIASTPTAEPPQTTPMPSVSIRPGVQPAAKPTLDFQKPVTRTATAAVTTIPFGERLAVGSAGQGRPPLPTPVTTVPAAQPAPAQPTTSPSNSGGDGVSAASFPIPGRTSATGVQTVATLPTPQAEPAFPVPGILTGKTDTQPRRPIQVVRVPTAENGSPQSAQSGTEKTFVRENLGRRNTSSSPTLPPSVAVETTSLPFPTPTPLGEMPPVRVAAAPKQPVPSVPIRAQTTATQPVVVSGKAPIRIPVPTPERAATTPLPAPVVSAKPAQVSPNPVQPVAFNRPVSIPVPLPESRPVPPPIAAQPQPRIAAQPTPAAIANLLPVPDSNIPLGNVGNSPEIRVYGRSLQANGSGPPVPPTRSALVGIRYRVVVDASDDSQQSRVRTLIPDAFVTSSQGRTVLQVGAFGDRTRADELVQTLSGQGLTATIEPIN